MNIVYDFVCSIVMFAFILTYISVMLLIVVCMLLFALLQSWSFIIFVSVVYIIYCICNYALV